MLDFKDYNLIVEYTTFDAADIGNSLRKFFNKDNPILSKSDQIVVSNILRVMKSNTNITLNALRLYMINVLELQGKKDNQRFNLWWESFIKNIWKSL